MWQVQQCKTDIGMRPALITLGHKQPETPLKT